jgi:type I restriction enzyme S subunit
MKSVGNWERLGMKFKLGDICSRLSSGKGISAKLIDDVGKFPVYGGNGLRGYTAQSNFFGECAIIGRQGAFCGNVRYFSGEAYMTEHAIVVCANKDNNTRYLAYLLGIMKLGRLSGQSAQPGLSVKTLAQQDVDMPPLEQQRKVAKILATIEKKIELNNKINENLEQQAQAIFANMFDESNTTQATISDVSLNVTDGVHNTVHDDPEGEYLLLSCKNIKGGSLNIGTSERRISRDTFEKLRRRTKLSKGDVLISSVGTIGELLLLNNEPLNYEFQRSVAMVKPNPSVVSSAYLYESLLSNRAKLINSAHGAVQQCLFISDIAEFPIRIPQQDILSEFDTIVTPMLDIVTANENENIKLSQLRDTLLPKLMSDEIDVSDLEF